MNKEMKKHIIQIVAFGILLCCAILHLDIIWGVISGILSLLLPFILGGAIAFILNVPMKAIEKLLFRKNKKGQKWKRVLSYVITVILLLGIVALALVVIIPELVNTVKVLGTQVPKAIDSVRDWIQANSDKWPAIASAIEEAELDFGSIASQASGVLQKVASGLVSSGVSLISGIVSGIVSFFIGVVFSVYVLFQKEKLSIQTKKIMYALLPEKKVKRIISIGVLTNQTFSNFLSGQCLEACILGAMFVIAMTIFQMPYAMLVGVLIALTALIPVVGAFIGCGVGAFLIVMVNPMQAFWFIVLFLVLQQIEGNLIYPRVVGGSIGLPSIWVLVAVSVGGSLFGILGILVFIPLCSVCYALFRDFVNARLKKKGILQLF